MKIERILRGRVVIREIKLTSSVLFLPDAEIFDQYAKYQERTHRGVVLGMGEPPFTESGHVVTGCDFRPGDTVEFHFAGTEQGRTAPWKDGEPALWLHFKEVDCVIDP